MTIPMLGAMLIHGLATAACAVSPPPTVVATTAPQPTRTPPVTISPTPPRTPAAQPIGVVGVSLLMRTLQATRWFLLGVWLLGACQGVFPPEQMSTPRAFDRHCPSHPNAGGLPRFNSESQSGTVAQCHADDRAGPTARMQGHEWRQTQGADTCICCGVGRRPGDLQHSGRRFGSDPTDFEHLHRP